MSVMLFVEGGGNGRKDLRTEMRKAFQEFLTRAGFAGRLPRVVPSGSRNESYKDFCTELRNGGSTPVLLVDSEDPVTQLPWAHLQARDGWQRPDGVTDDQAHLMAQCMESWLLADRETLAAFFGQGFRGNALPGNPQPEAVPKDDVLNGLKSASHGSARGDYHKGRHSFDLLGQIDPAEVKAKCPHAQLLFGALERLLTPPRPRP